MIADIGHWVSYEPYHDEEQLKLQRDNLITLPIWNAYENIKYIPTRTMVGMEYLLLKQSTHSVMATVA